MSARVTQHVIEAIAQVIARSPTTPTGAGVTQHVIEALIVNPRPVRVTQHVIEAIVLISPDGSHGDGGGEGGGPTTHAFGYTV